MSRFRGRERIILKAVCSILAMALYMSTLILFDYYQLIPKTDWFLLLYVPWVLIGSGIATLLAWFNGLLDP